MNQLKIDARHDADGYLGGVFLLEEEGVIAVVQDDGRGGHTALPLPAAAIAGAFARYGKPLAEELKAPPRQDDDSVIPVPLAAGGGHGDVRAFAFVGWGSVEPTDYLLWEVDGAEPLAAPAGLMAAALLALGRAAARAVGKAP